VQRTLTSCEVPNVSTNPAEKVVPMTKRKLRVLIAKFGEGHEKAMFKLASACSEAGFEVVYTDIDNPQAIVAAAIQEAVDHIGITTLPGATVEDFSRLFEMLKKEKVSHIRVTAGGFFPEQDVILIQKMGVIDFYPRGSIYQKIEEWTKAYGESTELS
jgi:methylmalonyl-CoA mutase, C-terminal domain